ncbi:MAG: hypothetical protein M1818_002673 [Claussenomyces sp. TS43310]|nr:MAG: hypothetical protein M1818_002673 [Claussenomyces sp. TS43310]
MSEPKRERFAPKVPVALNPPKNDPISKETLAKCNDKSLLLPPGSFLILVKGKVFDVTSKDSYLPGGPYHVFAGRDASRALGMTSTDPKDVKASWYDLDDSKKKVLDDWYIFFSKRYNIVGLVEGADNL